MLSKIKNHQLLFELLLIFIITIPAFIALFYGNYFTMHDDQHIVRLFLLDQGIKQGSLYPRWVDGLGFGYGYPLFNFYPPLIYYVAQFFHLIGFSLMTSIKLMIVAGFVGAAVGMYLFAKEIMGKAAGLVSTTLYTYFFYHAITVYVRGAFAEFFTFALLPIIFLLIYRLSRSPTIRNSLFLGISFALLILTHPLIAFPAVMYVGFFIVFYFIVENGSKLTIKEQVARPEGVPPERSQSSTGGTREGRALLELSIRTFFAIMIALGLSAFFWLPSMLERKFTMVDSILLKELASYKLHFIELQQLWYSPWGYGGSVAGTGDGFTFQLGKIHILFFVLSFTLFIIYVFKTKKIDLFSKHYLFFTLLLVFSLFMTLPVSALIWDNIHFLWYLQFPWRFLTFAAVFISLCGGFVVFFASHIDKKRLNKEWVLLAFSLITAFGVIWKYHHYFKPQQFIQTTDTARTTDEEIKWRISRSSFEFVPKGIKTTKSELGTTIVDIQKDDITKKPFQENKLLNAKTIRSDFAVKEFEVDATEDTKLSLNTYYFPGWKAYINDGQVPINNDNDLKLITISVPKGQSVLRFSFENTPVRNVGNIISIGSLLITLGFLLKVKVHKDK